MRHILIAGVAGVLSVTGIADAYAATAAAPAAATAPSVSSTNDPDYAKKLELARQMQAIQPVKTQVDDVVQQASQQLAPAARDRFLKLVQKAFDYDRLEKASVDAMVSLFTVPELQKMVDYYGSAEAKSSQPKISQYQAKLQPLIFQMLDKAMIEQRTGGEAPPPNVPKVSDVPVTQAIPSNTPAPTPSATAPSAAPKIDPNPAAGTRP
ncbi:MAG: hypothetical protein JWO78_2200 [Micavibrio sp.]|nr:hypothetical protein [Micavibrio sp.]